MGLEENAVASWVDRAQTFSHSQEFWECLAQPLPTLPPVHWGQVVIWQSSCVCVFVFCGEVVSELCLGPHPGWLGPEITGASRKIISICLGHSKVGLLSLHPPETARTPIRVHRRTD